MKYYEFQVSVEGLSWTKLTTLDAEHKMMLIKDDWYRS